MSDFLIVSLGAAVINNVVLVQLLGTTSLLAVAENPWRSFWHGIHTTLLLVAGTGVFHVAVMLLPMFSAEALLLPVYLLVLLPVLAVLPRLAPASQPADLALLAVNTAILGPMVIAARAGNGLLANLFYALGTGLGFLLCLSLFSALQERLQSPAVPAPFRGGAISLITAGLMSLGFMGLAGIV